MLKSFKRWQMHRSGQHSHRQIFCTCSHNLQWQRYRTLSPHTRANIRNKFHSRSTDFHFVVSGKCDVHVRTTEKRKKVQSQRFEVPVTICDEHGKSKHNFSQFRLPRNEQQLEAKKKKHLEKFAICIRDGQRVRTINWTHIGQNVTDGKKRPMWN